MGDFTEYVLGSGTIAINGVDAGYIEGDVKLVKGVETKISEGGVPKRRRGTRISAESLSLEIPFGQFNADILEAVLGIVPVNTAEAEETVTAEALTFAVTGFTPGIQAIKLGDSDARARAVTVSDGGDAPVITNTGATVTYVENDDYIVDYDTGYVFRNPGGSITSLQSIKATYKYTPTASSRFDVGANTTIPTVSVSFEHEDPETGDKITAYLHKAESDASAEWTFSDGNFVITNGKFNAIDNSALTPTNPLGYITKE